MGLLTSLFPPKRQERKSDIDPVFVLIGDLNYGLQIAGAEHYQKTLETFCGPRRREGVYQLETAWLILEDKDAVRVEIQGRQVGYLSAEAAIRHRQQLAAGNLPRAESRCQAVITGGWLSSDGRKGPYEVWLDAPGLAR
jgi:hypothetical protein